MSVELVYKAGHAHCEVVEAVLQEGREVGVGYLFEIVVLDVEGDGAQEVEELLRVGLRGREIIQQALGCIDDLSSRQISFNG